MNLNRNIAFGRFLQKHMLMDYKIGLFFSCFIFQVLIINASMSAQSLNWGVQFDNHNAKGMVTDNSNNVYLCGSFNGTVDFDPNSGFDTLTAISEDGFLTKLDSAGNYQWTYQLNGIGSNWEQSINACATDINSNIYIGCDLSGYQVGIKKLSSNGIEMWEQVFTYYSTSNNNFNQCNDLVLDRFGNSIIVGEYWGNLRNQYLNPMYLFSQGKYDSFIYKIDSLGNMVWGKSIGGLENTIAYSVVSDDSGNVYVTGDFDGVCDFDPDSTGVFNVTSTGPLGIAKDIFILKLNAMGDFVWVKTFNSHGDIPPYLAIDYKGDLILACAANSGIDFDPGPGIYTLPMSNPNTAFILKLDSDGQFKWVKIFSIFSIPTMLNVDQFGNILHCGTFGTSSLDLDPGPDSSMIYSTGFGNNGYFVKLNQYGLLLTGGILAPSNSCTPTFIYVNNYDEMYIAGQFSDTLDIDPSSGYTPLITSPSGTNDIFMVKYDGCNYLNPPQILSGCDVVTHNGQIITSSGLYFQTFPDTSGCDSTLTLEVTIHNSPQPEIVGDTLICTGNSLLLELNDTYITNNWSTGETSNSIFVSNPGTYSVAVVDSNGCGGSDSIVVADYTYPLVSITSLGSTTFCRGDSVVLSANPGLASYQWYRRTYAIPGATSLNYVAKNSGGYKCIAQNAAMCSDTSNIIIVNVPCMPIGPNQERTITNKEFENPIFQISPNPGTGIFLIQSPPGQLNVFNSTGQLILSVEIFGNRSSFDISEYSEGIYFVTLRTGAIINSQKIIITD